MTPIHDEGALEGLADVPWAELEHAYGSAEDVPGLLRAIASGDEQVGRDAVYELFGNIWHQGSVYGATPHAVPFLARLAAAGMAAEGVLQLLGSIAQSEDERGAVPDAARNAVLAQVGLLLPLVRHESSEVRALAAWTLAMCRAGDAAFADVHARWVAEESNATRCTLLKTMSELDPTRARPIAEGVVASGATAAERLVAAWGCVTTGAPWTDDLRAAALAWLPAGHDLKNGWWGDSNEGPFGNLLLSLAERGDFSIAAALAIDALALAVAHETFTTTLQDVEQFADQYRIPVPELAAVLAGQVTDPKNGKRAIGLLQRLPAVPGLADLMYTAADVRGPAHHADQALSYLVERGPASAVCQGAGGDAQLQRPDLRLAAPCRVRAARHGRSARTHWPARDLAVLRGPALPRGPGARGHRGPGARRPRGAWPGRAHRCRLAGLQAESSSGTARTHR